MTGGTGPVGVRASGPVPPLVISLKPTDVVQEKSMRMITTCGLALFVSCLVLSPLKAKAAALTLVEDGKARVEIVLPDNDLPSVLLAAEELQYHVRKATGATLEIRKERERAPDAPGVYLGSCRRTLDADITTKGLKINGWRVRSVSGSLFIYGDDGPDDPLNKIPGYIGSYPRTGTLFGTYDLLEREMGVRWLWPGELGTYVPKRASLSISAQDVTSAPRLAQKRWWSKFFSGHRVNKEVWNAAWKSEEAAKSYVDDELVWLSRHRFAEEEFWNGAHGFSAYWEKFGTAHPEWFAQMPDGSRGIDLRQRSSQTATGAVTVCVSNEDLRRDLVERWRNSGGRAINAGENDANGRCTCLACLAMDARDVTPETRLGRIRKEFQENDEDSRWRGWPLVLGSLSDRYARLWLAVQGDVRAIRPDAIVLGCAYANWLQPPMRTKLNEGIYVQMVPPFYFPFTDKRREEFRKIWEGWRATGCRILHRPNYTLSGHNMPIFYARKLGEDLAWQAQNGMAGASFDSLIGQWAAQGPNHYVLARILEHPELPIEEVLQEYYRAFGPASAAVEAYFRHWEKVSDSLTDDLLERNPEGKYDYVNSWGFFYRAAHILFTPEAMAEGRALLAKAAQAAAGDETAAARVQFLEAGLHHAELTLAVEAARRAGETTGDMTKFVAALRELDNFRGRNESRNIANMFFLWNNETGSGKSGVWNRQLLAASASAAAPIASAGEAKASEGNWAFEESLVGQYSSHALKGTFGTPPNLPLSGLSPWELVAGPNQQHGAVRIVEGEAPEGKRYLQTVSFSPVLQRTVETAAGQNYRIRFQMRILGDDLNSLAVYWNDARMNIRGGKEWKEHTLTVKGTGKDVLKFQRVSGDGNPCLDAISVKKAQP